MRVIPLASILLVLQCLMPTHRVYHYTTVGTRDPMHRFETSGRVRGVDIQGIGLRYSFHMSRNTLASRFTSLRFVGST